jgi:hypothetical protein
MMIPPHVLMDVDFKVSCRMHDLKGIPMDIVWATNYVSFGRDIQHHGISWGGIPSSILFLSFVVYADPPGVWRHPLHILTLL